MSWYITSGERRVCPPEYQERINQLGGMNRFGDPNFKLVWGETQTTTIYGQKEDGPRGQHEILQFGVPAWHLMEWKPPETFGSPEFWYAFTWDPETMVHSLGDFPWRGLYLPCSFNLYVKRVAGGGAYFDKDGEVVERPSVLHIDAMPLAHFILDLIIPNIFKSREMTEIQKKVALAKRREAEKAERIERGREAYLDAAMAFNGASGTHESNHEAWEQRIREKQAGMRLSANDVKDRLGSGHAQISGIRRK